MRLFLPGKLRVGQGHLMMDASRERFAPPALTGNDLAAEEIKAVIDAYTKSIEEADIELASEIWSTSEEASFIHPRGS